MTHKTIKPSDHPDFVGGWVWRELEMRWIEERIAKAIADEREACAKVCEDAISSIWEFYPEYVNQVGKNVCTNLATAIRARGQA